MMATLKIGAGPTVLGRSGVRPAELWEGKGGSTERRALLGHCRLGGGRAGRGAGPAPRDRGVVWGGGRELHGGGAGGPSMAAGPGLAATCRGNEAK